MHLTAHYTLSSAEALRGNRAFKRLSYVLSLSVGLMLLILGLGGAALAPAQGQAGLFLALAGLLFAALPEVVLRWALNKRGALAQAPIEAAFNDEGIHLLSGGGEGHLPWEVFLRADRRSGFWILRLSSRQAVLVPERALDDTGNQTLASLLHDRKLLKG